MASTISDLPTAIENANTHLGIRSSRRSSLPVTAPTISLEVIDHRLNLTITCINDPEYGGDVELAFVQMVPR